MNDGFVEREHGGSYRGKVVIDGVVIDNIIGVYFKQGGDHYLWLRREKVLEYDERTSSFKERDARPRWEAYLRKQLDDDAVAYKGSSTSFASVTLSSAYGTGSRKRQETAVKPFRGTSSHVTTDYHKRN